MKYPSLLRFLSKSWNFSDPVLLQRERIARMTVSFLNLCLISLMVQPSSASLRFSSLERLNLIFPRPVRCGRISHTRIYQGKLLILKLNHRNYFIYCVACPILNDTLQIIWSRNPYFSTLLLIIFNFSFSILTCGFTLQYRWRKFYKFYPFPDRYLPDCYSDKCLLCESGMPLFISYCHLELHHLKG